MSQVSFLKTEDHLFKVKLKEMAAKTSQCFAKEYAMDRKDHTVH